MNVSKCRVSKFGCLFESAVSFQANGTTLFNFGLEYDSVSFFPSFNDESFTWENVTSEASTVRFEAFWAILEEVLLDGSGSESVSAKSVKNRLFEIAHSSHLRIDVQGVLIRA